MFQTCSCQTGLPNQGCHFTQYVGTTFLENMPQGCQEIPTFGASSASTYVAFKSFISWLLLGDKVTSHVASTCTSGHPPSSVKQSCLAQRGEPHKVPNSVGLAGADGNSDHDDHSQEQPREADEIAFPTEAKILEKAKKKANKEKGIDHVVKKRPQGH